MKNRIAILVLIFIFCLILPTTAFARKGVGIVWDTETEIVNENSKHCIQYGIYNPWEEDVKAILGVSSDLKDIIVKEESEAKLIKAGTTNDKSVPVEFCFQIAEIYSKDCLIGNMICKKTCEEPQVIYSGNVVAMEEPSETAKRATGSSTSLGISVPLRLKVKCNPYPRDFTLAYILVIAIVLIMILWILYRKRKRKNINK